MTRTRLQKWLHSVCFTYETPKMVQIESKLVGITNNILLLSFIAIIILYTFVFNNGYQHIDHRAWSGTTCKVKGITYTNSSDPRVGKRIFDAADLYSHPVGDGSFFITTNIITTQNQEMANCPEEKNVGGNCMMDSDCEPVGKLYQLGHGTSTGKCNLTTHTCIVNAWCPVEDDSLPYNATSHVLRNTQDFTIFIKNHVYFPYYETARSNLIEDIDKAYMKKCRYHPQLHPYCPIFRLGDIVSYASSRSNEGHNVTLNDSYFNSMAIRGGVILVSIIWDCNLDYSALLCKPRYEFSRLDNYGGNDIATGYNFRYSQTHKHLDEKKRDLFKVFGVLFLVKTEAVARAFDLQTFLVALGSSLALLGLAPFISEIILTRVHKKRVEYQEKIKGKHALHELVKETHKMQVSMTDAAVKSNGVTPSPV